MIRNEPATSIAGVPWKYPNANTSHMSVLCHISHGGIHPDGHEARNDVTAAQIATATLLLNARDAVPSILYVPVRSPIFGLPGFTVRG